MINRNMPLKLSILDEMDEMESFLGKNRVCNFLADFLKFGEKKSDFWLNFDHFRLNFAIFG